MIRLDTGLKPRIVTALLAAAAATPTRRKHQIIHTLRREEKGISCLTEVGIAGLAAVAAPAVRHATGHLYSGVQGTGFGNGRHEILVVRVAPAPPADLGLAAAGDHRPVAHVSAKEARAE